MTPASGASDGGNGRPLDDTVAETGPGLSDDAVADGELAPGALEAGADAALARLRAQGWAPPSAADAEAETEAHPS